MSSNGTYVNGEKVGKNQTRELRDGDVIALHKSAKQLPSYTFNDKRVAESGLKGGELSASSKAQFTELSRKRSVEGDDGKSESAPDAQSKKQKVAVDDMEENMMCNICHDVLYKAVSAVPCMHTFCGGCYSDWMERSKECPQCRTKITVVSKNHIINNLVEAFLRMNPEKRRDPEDLAELDAKNKITSDKPFSLSGRAHADHYENQSDDSDDEDDYDDDDDDDDDGGALYVPVNPPGVPQPALPPPPRCDHCPPNTAADGFQCNAVAPMHLSCTSCYRLMPNRTAEPDVAQKCKFCMRFFCNGYWPNGCPSAHGQNSFRKLSDFQWFTVPATCLSRNHYEQGILRDYLHSHNVPYNTIWTVGLQKIDGGEYVLRFNHTVESRRNTKRDANDDNGDADEEIEDTDGGGGRDGVGSGAGSGVGSGAGSSDGPDGGAGSSSNAPPPTPPIVGNVEKDDWSCVGCASKIFDELCFLYRADLDVNDLPRK
ncbi:hypothetical protein HK104_001412 [Borealophlyctis nickersoniae]|nr:hypothetical protein HK104_001412 [Borealophlyctis nickersoniae]